MIGDIHFHDKALNKLSDQYKKLGSMINRYINYI
jgi:hypothetical protein